MNESGRNKMITGLEKSIEIVQSGRGHPKPNHNECRSKVWVNEGVLENIQKQVLEEAKTDL